MVAPGIFIGCGRLSEISRRRGQEVIHFAYLEMFEDRVFYAGRTRVTSLQIYEKLNFMTQQCVLIKPKWTRMQALYLGRRMRFSPSSLIISSRNNRDATSARAESESALQPRGYFYPSKGTTRSYDPYSEFRKRILTQGNSCLALSSQFFSKALWFRPLVKRWHCAHT